MNMLGLEYLSLKDEYYNLSGGEKHKLSIISALLKKSTYLFLDEPSNHLDDKSVKKLCEYLEEYSKNNIVIIVTHDPRIKFTIFEEIIIENNLVKQNNRDSIISNIKVAVNKIEFKRKQLLMHIWKGIPNIISIFICVLLCIILSIYNESLFCNDYCNDVNNYTEDTIYIYYADCEYGDVNKEFVDATGIDVKTDDESQLITYEELENLNEIEGMKEIVICNYNTLYDRIDMIEQGNGDTVNLFNIPQEIYLSYQEVASIDITEFGELVIGEYPQDYKESICITEEMVKTQFGDKVELEDVLGRKYVYEDDIYSISGVIDNEFGVCLVSYDGKNDYGYISYENSDKDVVISDILLLTEKNKEDVVLKELVAKYPATNYISSVFLDETKTISNQRFIFKKVLPLGLGVSLLFGVIILLIKKNQIKMESDIIKDYINYYFFKKQIETMYVIMNILQIVIAFVIGIFFNFVYSEYAIYNWYLLLIYAMVLDDYF